MTATNPQPPDRCPACGKDNRCEMARGKSQCWCFEMSVSPNVINNLSEEDVGVACLCSASGVTPSPCVRECELDPGHADLPGCLRTMQEIQRWSSRGANERRDVFRRIQVRRVSIDDHPLIFEERSP